MRCYLTTTPANALATSPLKTSCPFLDLWLQVRWLLKWRPGKELLTATQAGMGILTVKALLELPLLYSDYTKRHDGDNGYLGCAPSLLGNVACRGDLAMATMLLDMGESIEEEVGFRQYSESGRDKHPYLTGYNCWVSRRFTNIICRVSGSSKSAGCASVMVISPQSC